MNKWKKKASITVLISVVVPFVMIWMNSGVPSLKADSDDFKELVQVKVSDNVLPAEGIEETETKVTLELLPKKSHWVKIPKVNGVSILQVNNSKQDVPLVQLAADDFHLSEQQKLLSDLLEGEQTEETTISSKTTSGDTQGVSWGASESSVASPSEAIQLVNTDGSFGDIYIRLIEAQGLSLVLHHEGEQEAVVQLLDPEDETHKQQLVVFAEKVTTATSEASTGKGAEEPPKEESVTGEKSAGSASSTEDPQAATNADHTGQKLISTFGISLTSPFRLSVDVGTQTGTAAFDTTNDPGYDKDADNDLVRTFDTVSYNINVGLTNTDTTYKSFVVQLDSSMEGAWRKDSSGQVRQTAEFANGKLTDTGSGTKKTTHSTQLTLDSSGQAYFTEALNTYGAVNKDELDVKFTVTVVSATKQDGTVVDINQVVDSTIAPQLNPKSYISAKPNVDVKLTRNNGSNSTFEKVSGTNDKPNSLVTVLGAYVYVKPLSGRIGTQTMKGATYPVGGIKYTLDQKITYTNDDTGASRVLTIGTDTDPVEVIAYAGLGNNSMSNKKFTSQYSAYSGTFQTLTLSGTAIPFGYTRSSDAEADGINHYQIGVYDTGNPTAINNSSDYSITIENSDYKPISVGPNKWLYNGAEMPANQEPFSNIAMQAVFPYQYLEDQVGTKSTLTYNFSVSSVTYEGQEQDVDASLNVIWNRQWPGSMQSRTAFLNDEQLPLSSVPATNNSISNGDGTTIKGNSIWGRFASIITDLKADTTTLYGRWNANTFTYDNSRETNVRAWLTGSIIGTFYGVGPKSPDISLKSQTALEGAYTWYSSVAEAQTHGEISAVKVVRANTSVDGYGGQIALVPLKVVGDKIGTLDKLGNPNIALTNSINNSANGAITNQTPGENWVDYKPTTYDSDGNLLTSHSPNQNWGDTLYLTSLKIRPTLTVSKPSYNLDETITWTAKGSVESGSENNHKVQLSVTIPKTLYYLEGTAKDYQGNSLSDPASVTNADGSVTLTWVLDYLISGGYNPTVVFDTKAVASELTFTSGSAQVNASLTTQVWLEDEPSVTDTSAESVRTTTTGALILNNGIIVIDKTVDKPYIEAGNEIDPANPTVEHPTDFTYTIAYRNQSASAMSSVRVLDVLPYNGDGRGTAFDGAYTITNVTDDAGGVIWYTKNSVAADTDPNSITLSSGWYKVSANPSDLKDAKAILVVYDTLAAGQTVHAKVTLRPDSQKAGNIYANAAALNSSLNKFVSGVVSKVRVLARDFTGVAWYDDKPDGLIGKRVDGTNEPFAKDIPVKLYRTSLTASAYSNQLVKKSLTGEDFVDSSGNSLVKTDNNGTYMFNNLPEGDYIAEFIVGDQVVQKKFTITDKLVGSDPKLNSKADQTTYMTDSYILPKLADIPASSSVTVSTHHTTDVNIGLIRSGKIRLFKYEEGSAVDSNGDGALSDIEKSSGRPLEGATFDLYKGNNQTEKIGTATTDVYGYLTFEYLALGDYNLIETKSPDGYELAKAPIQVTISEGDQTVIVYQSNSKATELPYAGTTETMIWLLGIASILSLSGIGILCWYFYWPLQGRK